MWCCGRCCHVGPWGLGQRVSSAEARAEAGSGLKCVECCTAGLLPMPSVTRAEQGACQAAGVLGGPWTPPHRAGCSAVPGTPPPCGLAPGGWLCALCCRLCAVLPSSLLSVPNRAVFDLFSFSCILGVLSCGSDQVNSEKPSMLKIFPKL